MKIDGTAARGFERIAEAFERNFGERGEVGASVALTVGGQDLTQEFLLRRLGESQPRSLRLAVLLDKPEQRRVGLEPDYFGFRTASNGIWVGYGLAASNGMCRNEKSLSVKPLAGKRQGKKK